MAIDLQQKLRNPFVQQYAIEILFPLIGYFFFDWGILIIGVYYLLDRLAFQLLFFRRLNWMRKAQQESNVQLMLSVLFTITWVGVETMALIYAVQISQPISLNAIGQEVYQFTVDELWFLFPLVIIMYHLKDQFTFYMPRHYLKFNYRQSVKWNVIGGLIQLFLLGMGVLTWIQLSLTNWVVVCVFVCVKIVYDVLIKPKLEMRTFAT